VPSAEPGPAGRLKQQQLVNLGSYPVELHLPDRVVLLQPGESVSVTRIGGQVAELARQGLVDLRPVSPKPRQAARRQPARGRQQAKPAQPAGRATQVNGATSAKDAPARGAKRADPAQPKSTTSKKQADRPTGRTGRTRGGA
jgi:hypothetical protein